MISRFPEDYELIGFFEAEPEVADVDAPWIYNRLVFDVMCSDLSIRCEFTPSYGELDVLVHQSGAQQTPMKLRNIDEFWVETENGIEWLVARFEARRRIRDFRLSLRPYVRVHFGVEDLNLP